MANYIKSTDFQVKDGLLTGDPLKIVSGTELDAEFVAIQTAVNSKANTNSPSLTGVPTAPTASVPTNSNQIATTSFVQNVVSAAVQAAKEVLYPVGSIYTNATNNTDPATLLGFGTWVAFGSGRVMVGFNSGDVLFNVAEQVGGSKDAVVVAHSHSASSSTEGAHTHDAIRSPSGSIISGANFQGGTGFGFNKPTSSAGSHNHTITVTNSGESGTNKNLQPYIVVHMWKRTA